MATSFDIEPTARLRGFHFIGTVARRFLISYPVAPAALSSFVPPGGELCTWRNMAWVSACFVNVKQMRPSFAPAPLGFGFNYLIFRTMAELPFPDGKRRRSVLILEPNIDSRMPARVGALTGGIRFNVRDISLSQTEEAWSIVMRSDAGETLYEAQIRKDSIGPDLPAHSAFPDAATADEFLLGVSYGGQFDKNAKRMTLLAETHEPWETLVGQCTTKRNAFLESHCKSCVEADHVITMTDIPHYFAAKGHKLQLDAVNRTQK
ncbi:MAG: DUF2071 domain-containing protein [Armatimonadetes bacterium]|nr:DUF2071 domain-containing protein [Armatimonadota bacterium]